MEKSEFFIKKNDVNTIDVFGEVFKIKTVTADDELEWYDEYTEVKEEKDKEGNLLKKKVQNYKKLAKCKLRNIISVPFSKEEIKEISGINKNFCDFSNDEKDILFGQLNPKIMSELIKKIDETGRNKKKT